MNLQLESLKPKIDELQKQFGHPDYTALYGTGCIKRPDLCFIFMNPTARNVSVNKNWTGLKASWLGTKNTWKLLHQLELIPTELFRTTQEKKPIDWNNEFAMKIYGEIAKKKVFITNLARSTQPDARPLPNYVFASCLSLMEEEISLLRPKTIITFGNQVSSALLKKPIKVSENRHQLFPLTIGNKTYPVYPTYYPVGMGIMNMGKAIEDIKWVISNLL